MAKIRYVRHVLVFDKMQCSPTAKQDTFSTLAEAIQDAHEQSIDAYNLISIDVHIPSKRYSVEVPRDMYVYFDNHSHNHSLCEEIPTEAAVRAQLTKLFDDADRMILEHRIREQQRDHAQLTEVHRVIAEHKARKHRDRAIDERPKVKIQTPNFQDAKLPKDFQKSWR